MQVFRPNFKKRGGLVTVVAQHARTKEVLMVALADGTAWKATLETAFATYYSTSRKQLWIKGEESGNLQMVVGMLVDCDGDALVYLVEPQGEGVACHTNARSCFYRSAVGTENLHAAPRAGTDDILARLNLRVHTYFSK